MRFAKILAATDFSEPAEHAVSVASRLAAAHKAELVIAHSWYIPSSPTSLEPPFPPALNDEMREEAADKLGAAVKAARAAGAERATGELMRGEPWLEIVELLENQGFDLCVVGRQGRTRFRDAVFGTVAERIVRHAHCSVLAVHPERPIGAFNHVLAPTDFSRGAEHASYLAASLVDPAGTLTVMHVVSALISRNRAAIAFDRELYRVAVKDLEAAGAAVGARTAARVRTEIVTGHAAAEVLATVERDATIDLVVVGSKGRSGIRRALIGSVAEKVVRHAKTNVLVARPRG